MLAMQRHLRECSPCEEELRAAREIKHLLRALPAHSPSRALEQRIAERMMQEQADGLLFWPRRTEWPLLLWPRPQRGRRLAAAFALSCVGLFTVAAPFAPPFADVAAVRPAVPSPGGRLETHSFPMAVPRLETVSWVTPMRPLLSENAVLLPSGIEQRRPDGLLAMPPSAQPPLSGAGDEPLGDEAVSGYASGDAAFADYRTP